MKSKLLLPIIICIAACNSSKKSNIPAPPPVTPQLVWSDEFNYTGLPDPTKWNYDVGGHGWGNNELQFYTSNRAENARVENGNLVITAIREPWQGKEYSSARLISKGKGDWLYGKIEVRAKIPRGRGSWPAIWMLASTTPLRWPDDGEIDIMEHVGFDQGRLHASVHTKKYHHSIGTQKTANVMLPTISDSFHVYAMEWTENHIRVGVDGNYYFNFVNEGTGNDAWPFHRPFHLLLNIAVGGNWGGQQGIDTTIWPAQMLIDYVRVYQNK